MNENYDTPKCESLVETVKKSLRTSDSIGIERCMQCGACTSSCPAARYSDYNPRDVMKRVKENDWSVIEDKTIWNCFYCYTCNLRCPRNNSPSQAVQVLRQMAINKGIGMERLSVLFEYPESFAKLGISQIPAPYIGQMEEDLGKHWQYFRDNLEDIRKELGLGPLSIEDERGEIKALLKGIGFEGRFAMLKEMAAEEGEDE
ncbi:ferredoxin:CoB-CoM heterodisulfide reductase subunit HdrC [Methanohalophilus halophilus]|uniref:4Fe-4S dicluster domain-containing protein n=1 Tax=Methanohalophilus halophilus TaxID=2177 RepID=A0A1L3Q071_9EURY|nr:ferredoxin:CoB-CoM heterodisulfide reductase subunit HdrC [Methanohalophilus halophilus]APH38270.1 heterodisulfide reductase [Methanohalophilus halophilus]RNI10862.1 4Fe-4S dicluster domain-containing protein [Methanohalophilus halophilus]SDW00695.1 heterodisulfide reductase subunit C [Methanohalophilus halophilus]